MGPRVSDPSDSPLLSTVCKVGEGTARGWNCGAAELTNGWNSSQLGKEVAFAAKNVSETQQTSTPHF